MEAENDDASQDDKILNLERRLQQTKKIRKAMAAPKVSKSYSKTQTLLVTADDLTRLDISLRRRRLKPRYKIECRDGLERRCPH